MTWRVEVTDEFSRWARELRKVDRDSSRQVGAAVELLKQHGPSLKRPLVGEITTNPWQQIVLLVAGDKAGDWLGWYRKAVPRAEELYAEHIEALGTGGPGGR